MGARAEFRHPNNNFVQNLLCFKLDAMRVYFEVPPRRSARDGGTRGGPERGDTGGPGTGGHGGARDGIIVSMAEFSPPPPPPPDGGGRTKQ